MNKTFLNIGIVAASLLALSACNRQEIDLANEPEQEMVTFTFTAEKPVEESRTASVEGNSSASYIWTDEDIQNLKLFQVTPDSQYGEVETQISAANLTVTRPSDTKLVVTASVAAANSYTFRAKLSKDLTAGRHVKVPKNQSPETTTYDPDADVLVSADLTCSSPTDLALEFSRPAVINKMTLKNLASGEKVQKVIISSDKYLTGYYNRSTWTGQEKSITLTYNNEVVGSNGQFPVYFVSMPNTGHTLSVYVVTNEHTYSKAAFGNGSIALNQGYFTRFGVTLPTGTALADPSGMYLIGSYVSGKWILMDNEVKSNYYNPVETQVSTTAADVDFSEFSDIADIDDYVWTIAADDGGYYIRNYITSKYVSLTGNGSYAGASTNLDNTSHSTTFQVVYDRDTKEASLTSMRSNTEQLELMYNSQSSPSRFNFYKGTQQKIYLIPAMIDPRTKVTLTFSESIINRTTSTFASFSGMTPTANPNVSAITSNITYSWSGDAIGSVAPSTGVVTLNGSAGNATVTASFAGDQNYRSATASYQIIVSSDSGPQWVLIESASDVVEGEYVITWNNTYYLPSNNAVSTPPVGSGITVANNKLTNTVTDAMVWSFTGNNNSGFEVSAAHGGTTYRLQSSNNSTGISVVTGSTNITWTASDDNTHGMLLKGSDAGSRYLTVYNNADWRYYALGSYSGTLRLYKKEFNDGKTDAGISYSPNQATITYGGTLTQPTLNNPNQLSGITYQSDDSSVATVDASTGVITVVGVGSATITASWNDETISGVIYRAGTATFVLTVEAPSLVPSAGTVLFSETFDNDFNGTSAQVYYLSSSSTGAYNQQTYGSTLTYTRSNNNNVTLENSNSAGGSAKQVMINKNGGSLTIGGIKTYGATRVRVTFKYICAKSSAPITSTCGSTSSPSFSSTSAATASYDATVSGETFSLLIQKTSTQGSTAARFDNITITVLE